MHTSPITLSLPVTLLNDWRLLCQLKQQQEPTQHASQCFMPARQPESDNKVAYFNGKTLVTTAAAPQNWCWILKDRGLTKSLMHVECDTWLCFGKKIAALTHYQEDLLQPKGFSSTSDQQFIGGSQSIKAFPESVGEINISVTQLTTRSLRGREEKINKQSYNELLHLLCMQIRLIICVAGEALKMN